MTLRGRLLRLWMVFSIACVIAVGFHAYWLWSVPVRPWTAYRPLGWSYPVTKELPTRADLRRAKAGLFDRIADRRSASR